MSAPISFASGTAREGDRDFYEVIVTAERTWISRDLEKGKSGWREKEVIIETIMFQTPQTESAARSENHHISVPAALYFNDQFSSALVSF